MHISEGRPRRQAEGPCRAEDAQTIWLPHSATTLDRVAFQTRCQRQLGCAGSSQLLSAPTLSQAGMWILSTLIFQVDVAVKSLWPVLEPLVRTFPAPWLEESKHVTTKLIYQYYS